MKSAVTVIIVGISLWITGLVIALATHAESKVLYTCGVGISLGLIGIRYTIRRARRSGI
jgi:hypothetical protein